MRFRSARKGLHDRVQGSGRVIEEDEQVAQTIEVVTLRSPCFPQQLNFAVQLRGVPERPVSCRYDFLAALFEFCPAHCDVKIRTECDLAARCATGVMVVIRLLAPYAHAHVRRQM